MSSPDRRTVLAGLASCTALACTGTSGVPTDTSPPTDTDVPIPWATGGAAVLAETYPVPFDDTCAQDCELTLGPCYIPSTDRKDISEGVPGLPMRVSFRVVDTDCTPVEGVVVDIWHCAPNGLYSGADTPQICTTGDQEARDSEWFRGLQVSDADGRVDFDSCMPGWYPGRAVHIHFQVRTPDGQATLTSQFGFDPALVADIYATHPDYAPRGQPDTSNASDAVFANGDAALLFDGYAADDGALVVHRTLVVRSSLADPTC